MADINSVPVAALVVVALISLFGSTFSSIVLAALTRITRTEAAEVYTDGRKAGRNIMRIVDRRPAATAAIVAVRNLFVSVFAASVTILLALAFSNTWQILGLVLVIAIASAIFATLLAPSSIGARRPVQALSFVSTPLWWLTRFFSIFVRWRETSDEEEKEAQSEDQLAVMVERVSESDVIEDDERDMLQSVFQLSHTLVREVMVPRTDMISINVDQSLDKVLSLFTRSGYSRVPVIGDSVDELRGVVYLKDVMRRVHHRSDADDLTVGEVMRVAVFVPETKMVDDLLHEMQQGSVHIALVVDEYGGIAGLVTIEDLLEELVGELNDEHDRALPEIEELKPGTYRVPARMPIDELGELFGLEISDDDVDTAGGLLAKAVGRVPIAGSETNVAGLHLTADRFEGRRKRLATIVATLEKKNDD